MELLFGLNHVMQWFKASVTSSQKSCMIKRL